MPRFAVLIAAVVLASVPAFAQPAKPLTIQQQLAFLSDAKIVSSRPIGKGVTGALRVTLSDGSLTHDAAFQAVADAPVFDGRKRSGEIRFVDHYRYNLAAWRLATVLGLAPMMPATVERTIEERPGALSWWIDDVLMDEGERLKKNVQPADALGFVRQRQRMMVFAELVRDVDRNQGNVVYTKDWRVIMLDFTRAFRLDTQLRTVNPLTTCDRRLLAAMRAMTRAQVDTAVGSSLTEPEIAAVMTRRDRLVGHFDKLIAERGEGVVLY